MTRINIVVFVEGQTDRYYYSQLCDRWVGSGASWEIATWQDMPEVMAGGKSALVKAYKYLRTRRSLAESFKGKKTAALFFLDKDVDDILGILCRSEHVAYTSSYDIENHFYETADLPAAIAAAASLDIQYARRHMRDQARWRANASAAWQEWVSLCLCARLAGVPLGGNYAVASRVNLARFGSPSPALIGQLESDLAGAVGGDLAKAKRLLGRSRRIVADLYATRRQDVVFKGKWYALFLRYEIATWPPKRTPLANHFDGALLAQLMSRAPVDGVAWIEPHKRALSRAMAWVT